MGIVSLSEPNFRNCNLRLQTVRGIERERERGREREGRAVGKVVSVVLFWLCPLDHCGRLEGVWAAIQIVDFQSCDF